MKVAEKRLEMVSIKAVYLVPGGGACLVLINPCFPIRGKAVALIVCIFVGIKSFISQFTPDNIKDLLRNSPRFKAGASFILSDLPALMLPENGDEKTGRMGKT